MTAGFVCAINRGRDAYQVPLALHEAGLLSAFVTDFYAPDRWRAALPGPLARRHAAGLPSAVTRSTAGSFAVQAVSELVSVGRRRALATADALLAARAARVATDRDAHLYCYAGYLPPERRIGVGVKRVVFAFHPLAAPCLALLRDDADRFPQARGSFAREQAAAARVDVEQAWTRADAVVCASAMTRRTLLDAGCPAARITVVPYGASPLATAPAIARRQTGRAEFLFVGQGIQRKGLHHLIAAWQALDLADARLTLVCYDIDPAIAATIRSPTIRLLGRQAPAALRALYAASDVFAMPSLVEGFGLVYLDALAQGCHIVGTPNTGLPDLHLPAAAATLVTAGDLDALAAALVAGRDAARTGRLDRAAIMAAAARWRWTDFRATIARHAEAVLAA